MITKTINTEFKQSLEDFCKNNGLMISDTGNNGAKVVWITDTSDKNKLHAILSKLNEF